MGITIKKKDTISPDFTTNGSEFANQMKTAYQKVVEYKQPNTTPKEITTRRVLAQIQNISKKDTAKAQRLFDDFTRYQLDPTTPFYDPYTQATNRSVSNLQGYGFDINNLTDAWFNQNQGWIASNLLYNGTTNTPSKPGTKATYEQKLAYELYQYQKSESDTKKAEEQWAALQNELAYWARRSDRNYSDDYIINEKIDWSKYGMLTKMDENKYYQPTELNRAIGYSKDALYGVLWAARNDGGTGNIYSDMANSYIGKGNTYKENPEITAKLNWNDKSTYSPFSAGMTLEEEGLYYDLNSFGKREIERLNNRQDPVTGKPLDPNDKTAMKMRDNVLAAEEDTANAETELNAINNRITTWINNKVSETQLKKNIENYLKNNCPTLLKMDEDMNGSPDSLMATTRAVNYKHDDLIAYAMNQFYDHAMQSSGTNYVDEKEKEAFGTETPTAAAPSIASNPVTTQEAATPSTANWKEQTPGVQYDFSEFSIDDVQESYEKKYGPGSFDDITPSDIQKELEELKWKKEHPEDFLEYYEGTSGNRRFDPNMMVASAGISDMPTGRKKTSQQEEDVINAKNTELRDVTSTLENILSKVESSNFFKANSVVWDNIKAGWNDFKSKVFGINSQYVDNQRKDADNKFSASYFETAATIADYEDNESRIKYLEDEQAKINQQLGNAALIGKELNEYAQITEEINGYPILLTFQMNGDGKYEFIGAENTQTLELSRNNDEGFYNTIGGRKDFEAAVARSMEGINNYADQVRRANMMQPMLDEENQAKVQRAQDIQQELRRLYDYRNNNIEFYEDAKTSYNHALNEWESAVSVATGLGNSADITTHQQMLQIALNYRNEPEKQRYGYNVSNMLDETIWGMYYDRDGKQTAVPKEVVEYAETSRDKLKRDAEGLKYALEYFGDSLPENYRQNMETELANYQRAIDDYDYFLLRTNDDWDYEIKHGEVKDRDAWEEYHNDPEMYAEPLTATTNRNWNIMTQGEKDRYFYLLGKEGEASAEAYYNSLTDGNGILNHRMTELTKEAIANSINDDWLLLNAIALGTAPVSAVMSGIAMAVSALGGAEMSEDNPLLWLNTVANTVNQETSNMIKENLKDSPFLQTIASGAYEIVYNRGRSFMNAAAFPFLGSVNEFVGSMPMAVTAMADEVAKAMDAGADDWQAWALGGITLLCEAGTEMINLKDMEDAKMLGYNSLSSIKDFLRDYPIAGLSEALGESLNDIIERHADNIIMGDESEYNQRVYYYKTVMHMTPEQAMEQATRDDIESVLHTAIVSFLTPLLDVGSFAAGKYALYQDYMNTAKVERSKMNPMTFSDVREAAIASAQLAEEAQNREPGAIDYDALERRYGVQEDTAPAVPDSELFTNVDEDVANSILKKPRITPTKSEIKAQEHDYLADLEVLESAKGSNDASVRSSSTAAVLDIGSGKNSGFRANAAAMNVEDTFENGVQEVQDILTGGMVAEQNAATVKMGIIYATLGGGESQCSGAVRSSWWTSLSPDQKAVTLARLAVADAANQDVQRNVSEAVHDNRVAEVEKQLIANGAMEGTKKAQAKFERATADNKQADVDLESKKSEAEAAAQAHQAATEQLVQNPTDENVKQVQSTAVELGQRDESVQQYEQHKEKMQAEQEQAQAELEETQQKEMTAVRQQAEDTVAQQEQAEAEAEAKRKEEIRAQQEQIAQQKAEEDERSGKAQEDRNAEIIEGILDREGLEEGEERDKRRDELANQLEKVKIRLKDLKTGVSNAEGMLAMAAFERKLGIPITWADLGKNARGMYGQDENGNATIFLNKNLMNKMSVGQAILEAALHEITHSIVKGNAYKSYRNVVLQSVFGIQNDGDAMDLYNENSDFRAKIDQMIVEREDAGDPKFLGDDEEKKIRAAEEEIVADFARLNLAERDVVSRFIDSGLGGRMRNALHNINQMLKNYTSGLDTEERKQAEYFRKAERAFQKAIDEAEKTTIHPEEQSFSIVQVAQATGMRFDAKTLTLYNKDNQAIDGVNNKLTNDDMVKTPVGFLIRSGLNMFDGDNAKQANMQPGYIDPTSTAGKALDMMTGLMNMIARYKDSDLVWEIGASTLSSTFSALKSNSDTQYQTTVDFGTICAKTQAIVDVMSQVMLDKIDPETGMIKEGMKAGLTRTEIMKVYNATHNANLSVPCPVCYVFSRWMGVPSLLGQMSQFQKDHVITQKDADGNTKYDKNGRAVIDWDETQKHVDEYVSNMLTRYGDKKAINDKKTRLQGKLKTLEEKRNALEESLLSKDISEEEKENVREKIDGLLEDMVGVEDELAEVRAFNWVSQALCVDDGKFKVDRKKFRITPDSVIFDMNRTSEFAEDEKNWRYRTTRGAGMGKAINPYSGETIGDILYGEKGKRQSNPKNPWLNYVEGGSNATAARQLRDARTRAKKQNLLGGQRLQSTSDFRPEWGLDYVMSFLELQAAGSKVQMYTKVAEAIDFFASVGADVNMSIMGKGTGWREATEEEIAQMTPEQREAATLNGKIYMLEFSDITGMDFGKAKEYKDKYDNVQMILVGMNDTHIRLAMKNGDIDFIIPWHSSGNSKEVLSNLISAVGEKLNTSVDYTTTQSDMKKGETKSYYDEDGNKVEYSAPGEQTAEEKQLWDLRMRILTGKANNTEAKGGFTAEERQLVYNDPWLGQLYNRFYVKGVDDACYGVKLSSKQAGQIFPYEYWDTSLTKDQADENGRRFVEYCERMGVIPRFSQFKDDTGYWKLLIDRPMYNNDGTYHEQKTIDVTNARIGQLDESGKLDKESTDLPTQAKAVYAPKDQRNPMYEEYKQRETNAVMAAEKSLGMKYTEKQTEAMDDAQAIQTMQDVYRDGVSASQSVYGEQTEADLDLMSERDKTYSAVVSLGRYDLAEKIVDEAAKESGYTIKAYHGTPNGKFNTFEKSKVGTSTDFGKLGRGFYFTDKKRVADYYAGYLNNSTVIPVYIKMDNPFVLGRNYDNFTVRELYDSILGEGGPVDEQRSEELTQWLIDNGYDGIIADGEYMVLDPKNIKSADAVTYDKYGDVIPLSERFRTDHEESWKDTDIRYSFGGEQTEADMDLIREDELNKTLVDSGAITQEDVDAYNEKTSRPLEGRSTKWRQAEGPAQRQFAAGMLQDSDEIAEQAREYALANNAYFPDTNEDQINRAINWIMKNGNRKNEDGSYMQTTDGYNESLQKITSKNFDYRSADGQARMVAMMGMAVAKNDVTAQVALADAFNRQGTDLGRSLQSRKLFRLMTPEGRIGTLQKMLENTQTELDSKGKNVDLKFSEWIYRAAAAATEEDDFQKVQQAAAQELAEQLPANWKDRIRSLRMLSMLANPRTHIRNVLGNAFFIPAVGLKNKLGAIAELGVKEGEKTKTLSPFLSKETRRFAREDVQTMKDELTGEAKYNEDSMVQREQKAFKGLLQGLIDFNSNALEKEDWKFLKGHYIRALGGWMMANGYTESQLRSDPALLEKGRAYAVQEAQKATYRDFNQLAKTLNEVSRKGGAAGFLMDAVLPFKKTPANILKRGMEYSPAGIMRSLTTDLYHLKQWNDYQDGKLKALPDKALSPTQFIDRLCSGLSGTAVMALGALLSSAGIVTVGLDDDDDELEKAKGNQEYAFKFSIGGKDYTFTMDWAAPMSMPFFVGAAIQEQLSSQEDFEVEELVNAFGNITEPVFNLSMLDGVNTLFKTSQYDDTNTLTQIGAKIASNYATSYVPSLLGAVARTVDENRRKAYVESGKGTGVLGTFRYAREQTENKIPGLSQTNIPYRNVWGEEETSALAEQILENFILPGYISEYKDDPILNEMSRLYDATGDASMIPSDPAKSVTYEKQKYVLTAEQWDHYKEVRGQTAFEVLSALIDTDSYKNADNSTQVQMIKNAWSYADAVGKSTFIPDYEVPKMGNNPTEKIAKDATITGYKNEMIKALNANDWEAYDTMVDALREADVEDSTIKTKIGDTYRDQWKDAYRKNDEAKMAEIEEILDNTGFSFNIYGKGGWMQKVDEEND